MQRLILTVNLLLVCVGCSRSTDSRPSDPVPPANPSKDLPTQVDETKAREFVRSLGGSMTQDQKLPGHPVIGIALFDTKLTDAGIKELTAFAHLVHLDVRTTQVTDAGMKEVAKLTTLTSLDLDNTKVTDTGLKELTKLTNLTSLSLADTGVTDAGVAGLQKALPKCKISK